MKKYSVIILSLLLVFTVVFLSGCEFEIGIGDKEGNTTQVAQNGLPTGSGAAKPGTSDASAGGTDTTAQGGSTGGSTGGKTTLTEAEDKVNKDFFTIKEDEKKDAGISEKRIEESTKEKKAEEKKDEEAILASKVYTIKGRMVSNGVTSEYKLAQSGSKYAVITAYNGTPLGLIIGAESLYLMSYNDKTYMEIPLSLFETAGMGSVDELLKESMVDVEEKGVAEEGTETIDGQKLTYKKYEDGSIDYYSDSLIIMSKSTDGSCVYFDEVINEAPDSLFVPPTDYESIALTAENIQKFTSVLGEGTADE